MQQVQYNKMSGTLKHNLRIEWKFGHRLILSISNEQGHKNSISESQNGPLSITLPNLCINIFVTDSKPINDETSVRQRHTGQSRNRKTKVTSTVTRASGSHGVNLANTTSPVVDKYLNGSPSDRDVSNGIIAPKPRVVTGKYSYYPVTH